MALSRTNDFSGPYTANGMTTEFPFALPVVADSDIAVTLDGVTVSSSLYTISRTGETGTVTFTTAPASGEVLVLLNPDFAQATEFETGASFSAAAINKALDRAASRDVYLNGRADRALCVPAGEDAPSVASLAGAEGKWLGVFNGQISAFAPTSATVDEVAVDVIGRLPEYLLSSFDGANDEARLNAAVTTVSTAGGGVIVIEDDLECDGLSFASTRTNVTLRGANPQTTIRLTTTATRALYIQGAGWRLENLTIEVQGNATSAAVEVRGGNFSADNVVFDFGPDVPNTVGLNFAQGASNCRVTNCRFIDGELQIIAQTGANNITVDNCSFTGAAHKGVVARGNATGGGNLLLTNCTFIANGIDCQPVRAEFVSHDFPGVIVSNCTFVDTVKRAGGNEDTVSFNGVSKFRATNNYVNRASDVGINASTGASDGLIANNVIIGTYNGAVNLGQLSGDTQALASSRTRRVLVANNIAIDCGDRWDNPSLGTNSPYVYYMSLRTTDCAFIGNVGYISGNQVYAPIRGALFGDNVGLTWLDNHLTGWTDSVEFSNIDTDSFDNGGRRCVTGDGATPTFTTTGDIAGSRTGAGTYVYTFATALPAGVSISVTGAVNSYVIAGDRLSLTVTTTVSGTPTDDGHTITIIRTIGSTFSKVNGRWPYDPTMTGSPAGSIIHNGSLKLWDGSAWSDLAARSRRVCVTTNAGASPTFTTTGDISGSRTGTGVYVYTFATALPADAIINVRSAIAAGRTRTTVISSDRLTLTVYLWTTTTANDHDHTVVIA